MEPHERAAAGVFLAFQYPLEIPGVATMTFLKAALNAQRKSRGEGELTTPEFMKRVNAAAQKLAIPRDMLKRGLNVGFSGGEKKRMEILQMALLEPSFCILDETDSGLDIDALRIVAEGVNALRSPERSFLVITHYQRLLNYIVPDTRARDGARAHRPVGRARNWRWNSKPTATPITAKPRRRNDGRDHRHEDAGRGRPGAAVRGGQGRASRRPGPTRAGVPRSSPSAACRTGGWRSSNTRTCAP